MIQHDQHDDEHPIDHCCDWKEEDRDQYRNELVGVLLVALILTIALGHLL